MTNEDKSGQQDRRASRSIHSRSEAGGGGDALQRSSAALRGRTYTIAGLFWAHPRQRHVVSYLRSG
jgi:hypothetical protein